MDTNTIQNLGVHCSVAGGLWRAFIEAEQLEIDTFQIATRNLRQWHFSILTPEEVDQFHTYRKRSPVKSIASHACYLINLVADNEEIRSKSCRALQAELYRCHQLQIDFVIVHPGSTSQPFPAAVKRFATSIQHIFEAFDFSLYPRLLIENTAGQGKMIGWSLEQLKALLDTIPPSHSGICLDTCHLFAAGYDLRKAFSALHQQLERHQLTERLFVWHLNDSRFPLGSRRDRHTHLGEGHIGLEPFLQILHDFPMIPKILETPKQNNMDQINLDRLRNRYRQSLHSKTNSSTTQ